MTPPTPSYDASWRGTAYEIPAGDSPWTLTVLLKVPELTILFWVVKILSTTVGGTAADLLSGDAGLGPTATTAVMCVLLVAVLIGQISTRRCVPAVYWLTVLLVSVVGTLFSDNLVDGLGESLWTSTALFAGCLAVAFSVWYRSERTLSVHTILTRRREAYYWAAVLCTFALGTSAGDLVSDRLALGYAAAALVFGGVVAAITVAYVGFRANAVLAFWAAYVATRPFGASIGDLLTAAPKDGGLGLGTNGASALFLGVILVVVGWFTLQPHRISSSERAAGRASAAGTPGTRRRPLRPSRSVPRPRS